MRALAAPVLAALAQPVVPLVQLVKLAFTPAPVLLNSSNWDLTWAGDVYKGAYGLGTISPIVDAPGDIKGMQFELSGAAASSVSMALDASDTWQGVAITIRTAILDASFAVVDAPLEWSGRGDTFGIAEDGERCAISASAESTAVDLLRGSPLTYSHADQQVLSATDLFFDQQVSQAGKPIVWPAREWFLK